MSDQVLHEHEMRLLRIQRQVCNDEAESNNQEYKGAQGPRENLEGVQEHLEDGLRLKGDLSVEEFERSWWKGWLAHCLWYTGDS